MATPIPPNEAAFTLQDAATAVGGRFSGDDRLLRGVVIDSRAVQAGNLFIALRGQRHHGNELVEQAH